MGKGTVVRCYFWTLEESHIGTVCKQEYQRIVKIDSEPCLQCEDITSKSLFT